MSMPAWAFTPSLPYPVELECANLSSTGMFLRGDPSLGCGDEIIVDFRPPGSRRRIQAVAVVVRSAPHANHGVGLRFSRMTPEADVVLRGALLRRRVAKRAWEMVLDAVESDADLC